MFDEFSHFQGKFKVFSCGNRLLSLLNTSFRQLFQVVTNYFFSIKTLFCITSTPVYALPRNKCELLTRKDFF